jgi:peptidoglycan hydrolase-like protein with peptidoglycan-binding domain
MEKQDVPNAGDEIRKLQEALRKGEDPGSTDGFMAKKPRASRKGFQKANGIKPSGNPDEQTAENFTAQKPTQAHTKTIEEKS